MLQSPYSYSFPRILDHSHLDPLRTQVEKFDSVTLPKIVRSSIYINPLLKSQNLTTSGIQVYSCNLNYFLALDQINLQISFQSICFKYFIRALFTISKIQQDEKTRKSLSQNWVENVRETFCESWWYCSVKTYFICYKNCMLHWLIFEFELEHQHLLSLIWNYKQVKIYVPQI